MITRIVIKSANKNPFQEFQSIENSVPLGTSKSIKKAPYSCNFSTVFRSIFSLLFSRFFFGWRFSRKIDEFWAQKWKAQAVIGRALCRMMTHCANFSRMKKTSTKFYVGKNLNFFWTWMNFIQNFLKFFSLNDKAGERGNLK